MWSIYVCSWVAFLLLLGAALQVDALLQGRFDTNIAAAILKSTPHAIFLALLWPLSGYLDRRRPAAWTVVLIHASGAILYGLMCYLLLRFLIGVRQPLAWIFWPLLYAMMTYCVIAATFHIVRMSHAQRRQAAAAQLAHHLLVTSEMSALRNKLNPHFLFNTLHSIIALTRKNPEAAETALFQCSDMLRYVLDTEKNGVDFVTLDDELQFVRDYLELESLRLGSRLQVEWELDEKAGPCPLPALSLQPLVENSIKHAINPHCRPGRILIRTGLDERTGTLTLTVGDDGPGADPDAFKTSGGLGIRTLERRLELEHGVRGTLTVHTAPGAGFMVEMSIPLAADK
ncbi:sensor histidine kinase [Massilia sp. YIM B02787]|uniref:Sensor histidine kinase n=2 Tax=Massilia orientalis TaxID=3050128 RepID=A0ACC7MJF2_9BURK|nr:histidine kinase [Massilia sp. YIM B02787]